MTRPHQKPLTKEQIAVLQDAAEQACTDNQRVEDLIRETMEATGISREQATICLQMVMHLESEKNARRIRHSQRKHTHR